MANEDNTPTLPDDGPWSLGWKELTASAGNVLSNVANTAIQDNNEKAPWELSGSDLAGLSQNKRDLSNINIPDQPTAPQVVPKSFGDIFSRLINTESGGKHVDSNGNLLASNKGAQGITQVMPKTGEDPGYGVTPIQDNSKAEYIRFGRDYLNAMIKNFGGNQEQAVAAYNAGPGVVQKAVAKANVTGGDWRAYIPAETRNYIRSVLG